MEEGKDPAIKLFGTTIPVVASESTVAEGPPEEGEVKEVVAEADSAASPAQGQKVSGESIQSVSFSRSVPSLLKDSVKKLLLLPVFLSHLALSIVSLTSGKVARFWVFVVGSDDLWERLILSGIAIWNRF